MTKRSGKIRVLVVEDSDVQRMHLTEIIGSDPRLEVIGTASDGRQAIEALDRLAPDVISMDVRMPRMDGLETTRRIMSTRPTPIVIVSASVEAEDLQISMNALKAGALTVVEKPVGLSNAAFKTMARHLCQQLVLMSDVRLVRQRVPVAAPFAPEPPRPPVRGPFANSGQYVAIGLAASTGGPNALTQVLYGLGGDFGVPILIVQHMTETFHDGFVAWLADSVPMPLSEAVPDKPIEPGFAYVAPKDAHLILDGRILKFDRSGPVSGHRPSGDVLFASLARSLGPKAIGVLLTGMGEDGADGMAAIYRAGGFTIAEDASTAIVHGMPGAAVRRGAVCEELPKHAIAARLLELTSRQRELAS